jgi:Rrf2 family nitric oxide-sensitive transcriptional repressor
MNRQHTNTISLPQLDTRGISCAAPKNTKSGTCTFLRDKCGAFGTMLPMYLKTQTDYALRTLLYLAFVDKQVPVDDIAKGYGISKDHLVKVVQQLARLGYVRSASGRTGGVRLARPAKDIVAGDVIGHFEGRNGVLPCVTEPDFCLLEPGCVLRSLLIKAEQAFYDTLGRSTIADLIRGNVEKGMGGVMNLTVRGQLSRGPQPAAIPPLPGMEVLPTAEPPG